MERTKFNFEFYLKTNNKKTKNELQKLSHHIEYLIDLDNSEIDMTFWQVEIKEKDEFIVVNGMIETSEEVDLEDLKEILYDLIITEDYEDLELYNIEIRGV